MENSQKKVVKKREKQTHICTGCINEFPETELFLVRILQNEMEYSTFYCEICVKKKNFPQGKIEVEKRVKEPKITKKSKT